MNRIKYLPLATLLLAVAAWAGEEGEMERPSMYASQVSVISAVVEAIDHKTRLVTVRQKNGEALTFTASEEARNLDQVSVGDVLTVEHQETVSIQVMPNEGFEPERAEMDAMARTEEGEMPGFAAMEAVVATATVEEINIEANTFKLKGPDGNIEEYTARNPENLKRSKVGDLVVFTITESIAATVEHATVE